MLSPTLLILDETPGSMRCAVGFDLGHANGPETIASLGPVGWSRPGCKGRIVVQLLRLLDRN